MKDLTTKNYIVTEDDIEVVENISEDIAKDELDEESRLVEAIVKKWNDLVTITENKTIKFSLIVHSLLKDYPDESKKRIMLKVTKHKDLKTSVSKDRIYQGLRLIQRRPDLIAYRSATPSGTEPYLKDDGSVFWEFYFNLYRYSLNNDAVVRLEKEGKKDKWSARKLVEEIRKEKDIISGDSKNTRKQELLKMLIAKIRKCGVLQLERINLIVDDIKNENKMD